MKKHYCPCGRETVAVMGDHLRLCTNKAYPHLWDGWEGISDNRSLKMAQEIIRLKALVAAASAATAPPALGTDRGEG